MGRADATLVEIRSFGQYDVCVKDHGGNKARCRSSERGSHRPERLGIAHCRERRCHRGSIRDHDGRHLVWLSVVRQELVDHVSLSVVLTSTGIEHGVHCVPSRPDY